LIRWGDPAHERQHNRPGPTESIKFGNTSKIAALGIDVSVSGELLKR
jgi:hypothetical protein